MLRILISENQLKKRIKEIATQIEKDYEDEEITFICI